MLPDGANVAAVPWAPQNEPAGVAVFGVVLAVEFTAMGVCAWEGVSDAVKGWVSSPPISPTLQPPVVPQLIGSRR